VPGDDKTRQREQEPEQARSGMSGVEVARRAVRRVHELTGIEPEGVTLLEPTDHGWRIGVEVVELERIPNSTDLLAIYHVELDEHGRLVSYRRAQRHYRGRTNGRGE
jgi:Gas vesicle synthesis protein GvpO